MTYSTSPRLKTKLIDIDWTPYMGQEIPIKGDYWHPSGHKIVAIVPNEIEDRTFGEPEPKAICRGEFLVLNNGTKIKSEPKFWLKCGSAILTDSYPFFKKQDLSMSIVDRIVEQLKYNGKWIIPSEINKYRNIEMDSELGRVLLQPCIAEFGSLDALKDAPAITEAKKDKSTGSVGWGHRSMD